MLLFLKTYASFLTQGRFGRPPRETPSDAQNCGEMKIFMIGERPFRHFVRVGRSKLL